jgi:predicted PolB exonuclease-like 3'-5' exonuclease
MIFRALDIETIPDDDVWTKGATSYRLTADARSKYYPLESGTALFDPRVEVVDVVPPPHACRVVALAWVDVLCDPSASPRYSYGGQASFCDWATDGSRARADQREREMLDSFSKAMTRSGEVPTLVTWNGRTFDLPVIVMRSFLHKLSCGWYYANKDVRYRYTPEGHLDLMDFLGDYGATRFMRLSDVARLAGLPGKTDMSGDKVHERVLSTMGMPDVEARSVMEDVRRYCLQDALQTALLLLVSRFHLGKVGRDDHNEALLTFARSPEVQQAIAVDWDRVMR